MSVRIVTFTAAQACVPPLFPLPNTFFCGGVAIDSDGRIVGADNGNHLEQDLE
jgi:hypothetical protein